MMPRSPFSVHYLAQTALSEFLSTNADSILGVIAYGGNRPASLPESCPFAPADLSPVEAGPVFEVWQAPAAVRYRADGPIFGAMTDDLLFGAIEVDEGAGASFQDAIARAYIGIFDFLKETGFEAPIRFWNYLPRITGEEDGMERYRRFNIGRSDVFSARLLLPAPPVASAVGLHGGPPLIYFLAGHNPAKPLENSRQVSAYHYPVVYGPRSPRFSRASIFTEGGNRALLISGTASIVGHESRHSDDLRAQIAETLRNISTLIETAGPDEFSPSSGNWSLKVYLRDPAALEIVREGIDAMFGADCPRVFLQADICRTELLLEIEALCVAGE